MQCRAKKKSGARCQGLARKEQLTCSFHKNAKVKSNLPFALIVGATSLALIPSIPLALAATLLGTKIEEHMAKKKVFVSFDFDNDRALKDFIIGQSKLADSPFEIIDHSLKEAAPERSWETKADNAIARSDIVIVMVGPKTHNAQGVLKEVAMARRRGKRIVQLIGYKDGNYVSVPNAGRLYRWNWSNLKMLLAA